MSIISFRGDRDAESHAGIGGTIVGRGRVRSLARPLMVAVLAILVLFGAAETVERLWLAGVDAEGLHRFHLARGIIASMVVAVVVALTMVRASPAWPASSATDRDSRVPPGLTETGKTESYARWFIAMRWILVALAGTILYCAIEVFHWVPAASRMPLIWLVTALAGLNLLYTLLVWRGLGVGAVLQVQGYVDLAILTLLLHYSGGVENPLSMIMILHVIMGGMLLSRRQCYGLAAAGSLMFGFIAGAELMGVWEVHTLGLWPAPSRLPGPLSVHETVPVIARVCLQASMLLVTAYFVSAMTDRLRQNERDLLALADEARAEQQLLERALDTTGTALRVRDRNLKIVWTNDLWTRWFSGDDTTAAAAARQLDGPDSPARKCLDGGEVCAVEIARDRASCCPTRRVGAGPIQCVFQITTAPLMDSTGHVTQVVELAEDITRQKETEAQMMRAGRLAALGELAGQLVHEVNNPVAIISGKARLLLAGHRGELPPNVTEELGKIIGMADRLARLARSLLASGKPSTAVRVRIDLREPILRSLSMIESPAQRRGIRILNDLPAEELPVVANAREMEQVFLNLFLNAVDAMPHGGRLRISARAMSVSSGDTGQIEVTVADTGEGIPAELHERIFEPFFSTKPDNHGTGLGLSVCRGLIRSHQGAIELQSEPGKGTRFIVKLPTASSQSESGEVFNA